jgi:hypothetical protein
MILSDEERGEILYEYMHDDGLTIGDMCKAIERAVLAKVSQQEPSWYKEKGTMEIISAKEYKYLLSAGSIMQEEFEPVYSAQPKAEHKQEPVGFIDANGDAILLVDGLKGLYLYCDQKLPTQTTPKS